MSDEPPAADRMPTHPQTGEPLPPRPQSGYYAGFSTLAQQPFWDEATRRTVSDRVERQPPIRFFDAEQARFWSTVFDHLIPQTDRTPERRIPILPVLDARLFLGKTSGYRFEDMPHDRDVYRLGLEAIDDEAQVAYGSGFLALSPLQQDQVLKIIHDGTPKGAADIWTRMSVHRFWQQMMQDAIDAYYAHPWAWDEIGFGGPAYPRAYTRLERGDPEPWEVVEQRYAWAPPEASVSAESETTHEFHTEAIQHRSHSGTPKGTA